MPDRGAGTYGVGDDFTRCENSDEAHQRPDSPDEADDDEEEREVRRGRSCEASHEVDDAREQHSFQQAQGDSRPEERQGVNSCSTSIISTRYVQARSRMQRPWRLGLGRWHRRTFSLVDRVDYVARRLTACAWVLIGEIALGAWLMNNEMQEYSR